MRWRVPNLNTVSVKILACTNNRTCIYNNLELKSSADIAPNSISAEATAPDGNLDKEMHNIITRWTVSD